MSTTDHVEQFAAKSVSWTGRYGIQCVLSSVVATWGMLSDSLAITISAMLLAPLMKPIVGVAAAAAAGRPRDVWRGTRTFFLGLWLVMVAAVVVAIWQAGHEVATGQVLERLDVRLGHFVVASCAAAVAALQVLRGEEQSAEIAGAAVAVALVPPGCAAGIHLAEGFVFGALTSLKLVGFNCAGILLGSLAVFFAHRRPWSSTLRACWRPLLSASVLFVLFFAATAAAGLTWAARPGVSSGDPAFVLGWIHENSGDVFLHVEGGPGARWEPGDEIDDAGLYDVKLAGPRFGDPQARLIASVPVGTLHTVCMDRSGVTPAGILQLARVSRVILVRETHVTEEGVLWIQRRLSESGAPCAKLVTEHERSR